MTWQISEAAYEKEKRATVTLQNQPNMGLEGYRSVALSVYVTFDFEEGSDEEGSLQRQLRQEAKRILLDAAAAL